MTSAWTSIASEFRDHYPTGRRLVAVTGADLDRSHDAADAFTAALVAAGESVERVRSDGNEEALRADTIAPFRADRTHDAVLVVSGPATLANKSARGMWNFILWQLAGDEPPLAAATALVDVSDASAPVRRFADFCALPASYES